MFEVLGCAGCSIGAGRGQQTRPKFFGAQRLLGAKKERGAFHKALVKSFGSAGEGLGRLLGEAGNGTSKQQYPRSQYGRLQGHNLLPVQLISENNECRAF